MRDWFLDDENSDSTNDKLIEEREPWEDQKSPRILLSVLIDFISSKTRSPDKSNDKFNNSEENLEIW